MSFGISMKRKTKNSCYDYIDDDNDMVVENLLKTYYCARSPHMLPSWAVR